MSQGGHFLQDIFNIQRDMESLLMDFYMQAPPQVVNLDDEDSVVVVASTEDEPSPAVPSNRRQPRTAGGIRRRAGASAAATNRRNQLMMRPPSSSTSALPTARRRARGTNRRGGRRGARARNSSSESEMDLDSSIVELDDSGPNTAFETIATASSSSSSAAALNDTSDGSGPHCPICLCQWTSPVSTLCGHIFCKNCIAQWIKVTKSCPVCKAGAAKLKTHPIFIS